jgi:hypothetical protein
MMYTFFDAQTAELQFTSFLMYVNGVLFSARLGTLVRPPRLLKVQEEKHQATDVCRFCSGKKGGTVPAPQGCSSHLRRLLQWLLKGSPVLWPDQPSCAQLTRPRCSHRHPRH